MKFEKLGNILSIHKGRKNTIVETVDSNSNRVLQIDDLRNDKLIQYTNDITGVFVTEEDLMIAWDGANAGTVGYGKRGYIGSTIAALRKKNQEYNTMFLGKFLQTQFSYLQKNATGATIPHIDRKSLENLKIPILNYEDQRIIATILGNVEALIKQRKESIDLLDVYLKSVFLEMFGDPVRNEKGWEVNKLKNICSKIGSGSTPNGGKESYINEGISLIRSLNVHINEFRKKNLAFITEEQAYDLRNVLVNKNDILLNITGASVARCCLVPENILPARVNQHVSLIRPHSDKLNHVYLSRVFTSDNHQIFLIKTSKSKGATREAITKDEIEQFNIPTPPIELQNKFAQIVQKTETLKTQYQSSLHDLENLFSSLSQKAFKGQLDLSSMDKINKPKNITIKKQLNELEV